MQGVAEQIERELERLAAGRPTVRFPRVAVMGCVVNGPGEAKGADVALCGGEGVFLLYENGELKRKVSEHEAVRAVTEAVAHRLHADPVLW